MSENIEDYRSYSYVVMEWPFMGDRPHPIAVLFHHDQAEGFVKDKEKNSFKTVYYVVQVGNFLYPESGFDN